MSALAPVLEAFFTERLIRQRRASAHTVASYRDAFRLLLGFARQHTGKEPCQLDLADLDAKLIGAFLEHLEHDRHNSVRSRNARLTAIRSFYSFAAYREPATPRSSPGVLAIPEKRAHRGSCPTSCPAEIDALLAAPDRTTWLGRRDHSLLAITFQAGLRVSELTALSVGDVTLGTGPHIRVSGKGRKERVIPLTRHSVAVLARLARRTRSRSRRAPVPDPPRRPPQHRRGRRPRRQARRHGRADLPEPALETRHPSRPSPLVRHATTRRRRRRGRHRPLARPRTPPDHPDLPSRRPHRETASPGPHSTTRHAGGTLQATRQAPSLPAITVKYAGSANVNRR